MYCWIVQCLDAYAFNCVLFRALCYFFCDLLGGEGGPCYSCEHVCSATACAGLGAEQAVG